jgi:hypothetical protein
MTEETQNEEALDTNERKKRVFVVQVFRLDTNQTTPLQIRIFSSRARAEAWKTDREHWTDNKMRTVIVTLTGHQVE